MESSNKENTFVLKILVALLTVAVLVVNYLAAAGVINDRLTSDISAAYPTAITPAGYAFAIWSLIYLGTIGFTSWQFTKKALQTGMVSRLRVLYCGLCVANIAWLFAWHYDLIPASFALMVIILLFLCRINLNLVDAESSGDIWFVSVPFGIYFGWITVATILNATILLRFMGLEGSEQMASILGTALIAVATIIGITVRFAINSIVYPLTIAWGITAIGFEQSGDTPIVIMTALGMMALIFFAFWGFVKDR